MSTFIKATTRTLPLCRVLLVIALLVFYNPGHGAPAEDAVARLPDIKTMAQKSSDVVIARVKSSTSKWVGNVIVTTTEVQPVDVLKGAAGKSSLLITTIGGTVGNIKLTATHQPTLTEGELAIFFLRDLPETTTVGKGTKAFAGEHGKIRLAKPGYDSGRLKHDMRLQRMIERVAKQMNG